MFLDGADAAMVKADWLGVNCYWVNESEMTKLEKGQFYAVMRERFPAKLVFSPPWVKTRRAIADYANARLARGSPRLTGGAP